MKLNEKVSAYSILINLILFSLKGTAAILSGSISAIAEMIHSSIDLAAAIIVFIGLKVSKIKSKQFPFGLYKVENFVSILVAIFILYAGFEIVQEIIFGEFNPIEHFYSVMIIYTIVLVITYTFSKYELRMAKKIGSPSLKADAKHIRVDLFSVSAVMIGITGEFIDFRIDKITALIIVIFILKTSIELIVSAVKVLLDGSLEDEIIDNIREIIFAVPAVKELKEFRGRNSGNYIFVEANITIDLTNFKDAHKTTEIIENAIRKAYPNTELIRLHYEPAASEENNFDEHCFESRKESTSNLSGRYAMRKLANNVRTTTRIPNCRRRGKSLDFRRSHRRKEILKVKSLLPV